ncbi:hypothetical protein BDD12DRAFT_229906 [Trichophaea hybrida]|nr:hypothetical protein BDD12DRAFT_229906 [Trichophaea hybrida]
MPFIQRGPTHDIPYLDIRLDDDVVVLRGNVDESSGALLKGHIALCVHDPVTIKSITLVLQGVKRLQWSERPPNPVGGLATNNLRTVKHEEIFYEKKWNFLEGNGHTTFTIKPNNYEYPFQQVLDGDIPESVEGLGSAHIIYRLKARVVRGKFSHDIIAKKHLRIIRTLARESIELTQTMSVENLWPNKLEYSISIPTKAVVFGTCIPVDIVLVPLLKGLIIGKITCSLKEIHTLSCPQKTSMKIDTRHIVSQTFTSGMSDEGSGDDLGRWVMHERVILPKSLNACVQDCEVPSIKIRHKLKFAIQLHNPDGHMSELRASLPVLLFISPHYLMDDTNRIPSDVAAAADLSELSNAPPRYDEHYLDRLYENLPRDNFDTPLPSGANTPMLVSRNNSIDNLASLANIEPIRLPDANSGRWRNSHENITPTSTPSTTLPTASTSDDTHTGDYFSSHSHTPHSGRSSRAPSPPPPLGDLTRVPSYTTAVRTGTRNLTDVPLYEDSGVNMSIRSAPVSPQGSPPGEGGFLSMGRPRLLGRSSTVGRHHEDNGGGMGRRTQSSHHLHSLGDLLEGLRG